MKTTPRTNCTLIAVAAIVFVLHSSVVAQSTLGCVETGAFYQSNGFTVSKVVLHAPLSIFIDTKQVVKEVLESDQNGLKIGQPFEVERESATQNSIKARFESGRTGSELYSGIFAHPKRKNCAAASKTIEVHFYVYAVEIVNKGVSFPITASVNRAAPNSATTKLIDALAPQFWAGYDRSRSVFAGGQVSIPVKLAGIEELRFEGSGSHNSGEVDASVRGSKRIGRTFLNQAKWRGGYEYSNLPAEGNEIARSVGYAQFIGAAKPIGMSTFVTRYGISYESGKNDAEGVADPDFLNGSAQTSVKLFAGIVGSWPSQWFDASYGIELGTASGGGNFRKQVFDVGYTAEVLLRPHHPLDVEARYSIGELNRTGKVSAANRFFGGNSAKNFIRDDEWFIISRPFIRSFAQNEFIPLGQKDASGGDKFQALNLTLSVPVYARPLVDIEGLDEREFDFAVNETLAESKTSLYETYYFERSKAVQVLTREVLGIKPTLESLDQILEGLDQFVPPQSDGADLLNESREILCDARYALNQIAFTADRQLWQENVCGREAMKDGKTFIWMNGLLLADPSKPDLLKGFTYELICALRDLVALMSASGKPVQDNLAKISASISRLEMLRSHSCPYVCLRDGSPEGAKNERVLAPTGCPVDPNAPGLCPTSCATFFDAQTAAVLDRTRRESMEQAAAIESYSRRMINRLVKRENLISIGPVLMFDLARISERSARSSVNTRAGLGFGGRFAFAGLRTDIGYSFNLDRRIGESKGAFVFSIGLVDILR